MIRTMLDSDDLLAFTAITDIIATYSDLVHPVEAFEAAHPGRLILYIDRGLGDPGMKATIADVETGALKPSDLPDWFDERFSKGIKYLTYYCNRSSHAAVKAALGHRVMWEWIATLDGTVNVEGYVPLLGPSAVQILGSGHLGIRADLSLVLNDQWHPSGAFGAITQAVKTLRGSASQLSAICGALTATEQVLSSAL